MEKYRNLMEFIKSMQHSLTDLFDSGLASIHDSTLLELKEYSALAQDYGLEYARDNLTVLFEDFSSKRHEFKKDYKKSLECICNLAVYLNLCLQRIEILQLEENMIHEE